MSATRNHERALFEAFLELDPEFSGEGLEVWGQPEDEEDFPDINGKSVSGRRIGVEIGEWLNEDEMSPAKRKQRTEAAILEVLGDQGVKTRHCPLWSTTMTSLRAVTSGRSSDEHVFRNGRRMAITRFVVHPTVTRYVTKAATACPSLGKTISPHVIRDTTATHLLRAGVDINTIRAWLGQSTRPTYTPKWIWKRRPRCSPRVDPSPLGRSRGVAGATTHL